MRPTTGKILFPPLPSAAAIQDTLRSYFAWHRSNPSKSASPVYAVLDHAGLIRHWSVSRSHSTAWGHRHLWEKFTVVRLTAPLCVLTTPALAA